MAYSSPLKLVQDFMIICGQTIRMVPTTNIPEKQLRINLINEEVEEIREALEDNDMIEVVDAIADILYVTYGAALAYGINVDSQLRNPRYLSPKTIIEDSSISPDYPVPAKPTFLQNIIKNNVEKLEGSARNFELASNENDIDGITASILSLVFNSYTLAIQIGVDIDHILAEVQASNMSKFGPNGEVYRREEDNKVLKGPDFFEPKIKEKLEEQGYIN